MSETYWSRRLQRRISRRQVLTALAATAPAILAGCFGDDGGGDTGQPGDFQRFSVLDFGARGDGSADDTAAINRAIEAAYEAGGGAVYLPHGVYRIATEPGIVLRDRVALEGESAGSVTLLQAVWRSPLDGFIEANGTIPDRDMASLEQDALPGQTRLTLTSTRGIEPGDTLLLGADEMYSDPPDDTSGDPSRYRGENVRVLSVDSPNEITLHGMVRDVYRTRASAGVRRLTHLTGVAIRRLSIVNPEPRQHAGAMVVLRAVRDFVIDDVRQVGADGAGIYLDHCLNGEVTRVLGRDFDDDIENGRFGYGIDFLRATENVTVANSHWQNLRHAVTTGGRNGERGVPRNIVVTGCTAEHMSSFAFDTHVQGDGITFNACSVSNSPRGAFNVRSPNTHVVNCHASWVGTGVEFQRCGHGSSVKGSVYQNVIATAGLGGYGIKVERAERVLIDGVTVDSCARQGVLIAGATHETVVRDCTIVSPNTDGEPRPAIVQEAGGEYAGTVIANNVIRASDTASPAPRSEGVVSNAIELSSQAVDAVVTGNLVVGQSGKAVEANGADALVRDNVEAGRDEPDR